ncbi:hypothetical protein B0T18DRAFT_196595 [Schizothecium vesticola]|uniref:Uncharacterized protein n=1 Tax=Schizothecium vesticola TaxID=314040 RepID=A0AA40K323_9PEZI|nr:hypothetical protein B0T18DRAFT_196595 [Schizothecium vesticola]
MHSGSSPAFPGPVNRPDVPILPLKIPRSSTPLGSGEHGPQTEILLPTAMEHEPQSISPQYIMPWHHCCPTRRVSDSNNPRLEGDNTTPSSRSCCPVPHTFPNTTDPHSSGPPFSSRNNTARHQHSVINASPPSARPSITSPRP